MRVTRWRPEPFGGILQTEDPPALVYVDREFFTSLGLQGGRAWQAEDPGFLSAPTEVHLTLTRRCNAACTGCYTNSTAKGTDLPTEFWRSVIDRLADAGVFHLAMGGGESTLRSDLFELAAYARQRGLVPNLTTNGLGFTPELATQCHVFGQINVSVDGLGTHYAAARGFDGFMRADAALRMLLEVGVRPGINCVVTQQNVDGLEELVRYADHLGLSEIEFLRFKPTGRGRHVYAAQRVEPARLTSLFRDLQCWIARYRTPLKIDCSFVPFLCDLDPDPQLLERFGVHGCEAGNVLAAVQPEGTYSACSFIDESAGEALQMPNEWSSNRQLTFFRSYWQAAPQPCASCNYRNICRGGCRAVAAFVTGTAAAPDPECPRVVAWLKNKDRASDV